MFSFVQVVAFAFAASFVWAADNITVADPTGIVQCVPYTFTWSGGTLPYTVIVDTVGFSLTSPAIKIFNNVNETSVEWAPDQGFPGDLQIFIVVMDSAGAQSNSSTLTLAVGDVTVDDAGRCLNNATLSAIDTLTTGTGFRTTTPGAQQSGFSTFTIAGASTTPSQNVATTIIPATAGSGSAAAAAQTGASVVASVKLTAIAGSLFAVAALALW